ncbi:aminopeptidase T [Rubritalea halochordaticola]|uniref:Aminopeptidase T n=1 Tax=Rubritalea halochordaticola TaxID=714537 RepID=A0ABP9UUV7_9BACT
MTEQIYRQYANLVLKSGVNLQRGQKLFVQLEACHWDFGRVLVDEAYKLGAGYVLMEAGDPAELKARVTHGSEESLSYVPSWISQRNKTMVEEKWARLCFFGSRDPELAGSLDSDRLGIVQKHGRLATHAIAKACGAGEISWAGAALPTPEWAVKVFPGHEPEKSCSLLWKELIKILKLDSDDPVREWSKISQVTSLRAGQLTAMKFESLRFQTEETDLTIYCHPNSMWIGGGSETVDGVMTIPNLPTFETFTTPDYRRTSGVVKVTYPVEVLGLSVEGAWFEFKKGKVVSYGASKHQDALDRLFELCPQARFLGEVALVDSSSPIYQSKRVFHSILFDENATSHIALGNGYVSALSDVQSTEKEYLLGEGINVSLVHHDFMIGNDQLDVTGTTFAGETVPIMRNGQFSQGFR